MSFLRSKHSGWTWEGKRTPFGGGGGGGSPAPAPAPSSSTSYSTNLPEYAQPYVENMLNAAQAQIYQPDMTTFRPYTPYSNNPQDYVASPSPLQEQAYTSAANMRVSPAMGAYQGLSGLAGANYAMQATSPDVSQAYMSPYMQNVVDVQKAQAVRDAQKNLVGQNMAAARQGTYGGARNALMQSEANRNLQTQLGQIQATGQQNAFQNAQQAQQFGANLGLQGYGQAANIAGQQLNQAQGIANLQNTYGAQQQAQQQQVINQAIQNYATAQQYPYMQLGILNSMLRGLPMQSTTTASYQAQPSTAMQAAGLLGAAGTLYGGKTTAREGGSVDDIKKMSSGGIADVPGYRYGGMMNQEKFDAIAQKLPDSQLEKIKGLPGITPGEQIGITDAETDHAYTRSNPAAAQMMAQAAPPPQAPAPTDRMSGIAQAGGDMFNNMGTRPMAGGGIIAFAGEDESLVEQPATKAEKAIAKDARKELTRADYLKEQQDMLKSLGVNPEAVGAKGKAYQAALEAQQTGSAEKLAQANRYSDAAAWLSLAEPTEGRSSLSQAARSLGKGLQGRAENVKVADEAKMLNAKAQAELEAGNRARAAGDIEAANKHYDKAAEIKKDLQVANINASAAGSAQRYEEEQIKRIQKEYKEKTGKDLSYEEAMKRRTESRTTAADSIESQNKRAAQTALQEWKKSVMYTEEWLKMTPEQRLEAENKEYNRILGRFNTSSSASAAAPASSAAPAPMPSSPDKAVVGQVYNTSRGPARWDGKQFVPV